MSELVKKSNRVGAAQVIVKIWLYLWKNRCNSFL